MERRGRIIAIVVVVILIVSAGVMYAVQPKSAEHVKLRIGVLPVIDTLPLYVGQERKIFEENGVSVELVQFSSAMERDSAFVAGEIDGYFGDLVNTLVLSSSGNDVKVVTIDYHTTPDHRMFGLLASPGSNISDMSGVANHEIATSLGSVSEYFVDEILSAHNMSGNASKIKVPAIPLRYQSLMSNQIELALLPEPFATQAIKEGARLIADDSTINTTATVIAVRGSFIAEHLELTKNFLAAYNESVQLVNQDPLQFTTILENDIHFPKGLEDGFIFPPLSTVSLPSQNEVARVQAWMLEKGVLKNEIAYESIVSTELSE